MPVYKDRHYCYLTLIEPFVTVTGVIIVVPSCSLLIPLGLHTTGRGEFHLRAALNREEFKNNDCFSFFDNCRASVTGASPWNQLLRYVTRQKQTERENWEKVWVRRRVVTKEVTWNWTRRHRRRWRSRFWGESGFYLYTSSTFQSLYSYFYLSKEVKLEPFFSTSICTEKCKKM